MLAFTVIVRLNKPEYCGTSLLDGAEGLLINPLDFECVEEAFTRGIIVAIALAAHAGA